MNRSQLLRESWGGWMSQSAQPAGPAWLQYVWTFLFSCFVAAAFTIVGFLAFARGEGAWRDWAVWGEWYRNYLVVSLAIGYCIHGLFNLARRLVGTGRIRRFTRWQRSAYFSVIPLTGVAAGMSLSAWLRSALVGDGALEWAAAGDANSLAASVLLALLAWFVISQYFASRQRRIVAERQAALAQLQLLQAQMEPHFLFNTLANVVSLMDADTPRAKLMLESFTDYLRGSLGSLRGPEQSLGNELDLIDAYLRVAKIRMDDRLRYRIDVPAALRPVRVPALSLQPLVENAVVHGLEPKIDGGEVVIAARVVASALEITVSDNGLGLAPSKTTASRGTGTALNNIRERLLQSHGEGARLQIEPVAPNGVRATLTLPLPK